MALAHGTHFGPPRDGCPAWLTKILQAGYIPYIATSRDLLPYFDTAPFGLPVQTFFMEEPSHKSFLETYLMSNTLSFKNPDVQMPKWVLIDCVLMQTAIVGFMKPTSEVPDKLLESYRNNKLVDIDHLSYLPISGHVSSPCVGGIGFVGISLFSLGREIGDIKGLGLYSKALALEVYRAPSHKVFRGIVQYDNNALRVHGRFSTRTEITQPMVPLHPRNDMTLIYQQQIDYDPYQLDKLPAPENPTFWLNARDSAAKRQLLDGRNNGNKYIIVPPFQVQSGEDVLLPIVEIKSNEEGKR